ncbi:hypothetical protein ES703_123501 [subsurface metagenome]
MVAVFLVGLAVTALLVTNRALTHSNSAGLEITTAEFLIEQIKELTTLLPVIDPEDGITQFGPEEASLALYDDLDDFDDASFSPPINADRQTLNNFSAYRQEVTVQNVSASNFSLPVTDHTSDVVRVTVKVYLGSRLISEQNWIRTRY